ncbi:MAG TPA: hypothetical protein DCL44_11530, partial [Elusimicrobia bacterium]|nr:hypothetical protein [Elusimicrobiota bacterium]
TASSFTATGQVLEAPQWQLADNVIISSEASAALGGGVRISTNVYIVGITSSAAVNAGYYQINGSTVLAVLPGDSLGVGVGAGLIDTGSGNSFMGYRAGYSNTMGSGNSFVGYSAGKNTVIGSANAIFGKEAGLGSSGFSFSSSTVLGSQAGFSLTSGNDNIFVGFKAGYNVTTGTGNIVIGYNTLTTGADAHNEINIGGVYKGNISSGTATIPKYTLRVVTGDTTVAFGETITVNSASDVTVTLPAVTAADLGAAITVVKLGTGKVTIAANGTPIADSSSSGAIYNNAFFQPYASITIRLADASRWGIISGDGAWFTTSP